MFNYEPSIRQKITLGYYAIIALIIGLMIFTYLDLRFLERRIIVGETISEFFDTTLEIRRFEKNFFLYKQQSDYDANVQYVVRAQDLIDSIRGFRAFASPPQLLSLQVGLKNYRELMKEYALTDGRGGARNTLLAGHIRAAGKDIVTVAEDIAKTERKNLQSSLKTSQLVLLISILILSIAVIIIGQVLSRMVVKPLKSLEESMGVIAEGRAERIAIDSKDREISSLTRAFNKMLKELERHERHLVQSEKLASLGTLLAGVAHELNNPLSNISTSSRILTEEVQEAREKQAPFRWPLDPDFVQMLINQINEQTERARNIVRTLLDFSRDREFKKESLLLKNILEETIQFMRGQVPTNIAITLAVPDDIVIFADKQRIQQVFLNLIKNAVDAMTPDEGSVTIKAENRRTLDAIGDGNIGIYNYLKYGGKCARDEDTVDIEVRDTGPGIPIDIAPKIFDPFFTTKDVGKGSGLGLFIVHEIIEEHDGCLAVDSEIGEGTSFLIRLPMRV
ncbi:MAG TPA: HAMP domain-containing sensor histidine kinase [Nitrospirota bacterium]|nr:HAMP domain-containing sensor histidine kinase [Nitrospirota bacterium]